MKRFFPVLTALVLGINSSLPAQTPDPRSALADMIAESDHEFPGRRGQKISVNGECTFFEATAIPNMVPGRQLIMTSGDLTFLMVEFVAPNLDASREAFFSMPAYSSPGRTYTLEPDPRTTNADKTATLLLLNGRKVANFMVFTNGKNNVLSVGPIAGRPVAKGDASHAGGSNPTPAIDAITEQKMQSFANGIQFLVQRAAGNFEGLVGPMFQKTSDGDPLYTTVVLADLQGTPDDVAILGFQQRYFFLKNYRGVADASFALTAFQALPKLITHDRYEVERDERLEKPTSSTYHLRYNGAIVGDLIVQKSGAKVQLTIGYRDGIPANMVMGTGRRYSESSVDGAKRLIEAGTVCTNCRGLGTEEIKSNYVYKGTGLPEMITVPCHFCHGTGHL